jgi:hypothetical protein
MHIYPTKAAIPGWSFGGVYRFTKRKFLDEIMAVMLQLSTVIDEINYVNRPHQDNHGTVRKTLHDNDRLLPNMGS